jgi:hypothetical protein
VSRFDETNTMTTQRAQPSTGHRAAAPKRLLVTAVWGLVALSVVGVIAYNARMGAVSPRIANTGVTGVPRPVEALWGGTGWVDVFQTWTVVMMLIVIAAFVWGWRRYPRHPVLLMVIASTAIVWQDPIMNWAPYAVYNPQLWHWPEDWPLVKLSPTVEPFIVIGYATFYLGPYFPAIWILRRLQARRSFDAFVWRHPLISLAALVLVIGFVYDAAMEIFLVRTQLYIYSQIMPFGSISVGRPYQFPLLWESSLVTLVMIPAAVLLYRDDTGRTQAEKLGRRLRMFRSRPAFSTLLVMFAVLNVAYFLYGAGFLMLRAGKLANSVACPWPFPEAKVYDPNGIYEREGQPGPYFEGHWNTWMSGQPLGRPDVKPANGGRCEPGHA